MSDHPYSFERCVYDIDYSPERVVFNYIVEGEDYFGPVPYDHHIRMLLHEILQIHQTVGSRTDLTIFQDELDRTIELVPEILAENAQKDDVIAALRAENTDLLKNVYNPENPFVAAMVNGLVVEE